MDRGSGSAGVVVRADWLGAAAFALAVISGAASGAVDITKGTWFGTDGTNGTLRGRDALGNPVNLLESGAPNPALKYLYDTQLDLTWLADGNAGAGSAFDDVFDGPNGRMKWSDAMAWAVSLTDSPLVTWSKPGAWGLPTVLDTGAAGCDYAYGGTDCGYNVYAIEALRRGAPLAHLYYDTLGNLGYYSPSGQLQSGYAPQNTGPFKNFQADYYWSSTEFALVPSGAWYFNTHYGFQDSSQKSPALFALAVRPGDVAPIPEASTWAMLLVGLAVVGIVGARLRR